MRVFRMSALFVFMLCRSQLQAQSVPQEAPFDKLKTLKRSFAPEQQKKPTMSPLTSLQASVKGTFWRNPEWVKLLDLSIDQQKKMDDIFQQHRLRLIDLSASLQKEELLLEPLLGSAPSTPEAASKILSQIDHVADARAELEKANSRMLISILEVLTPEQWAKLPMPAQKGRVVITKPQK